VYGRVGDRPSAAKLIVLHELARYREPQRAVDALAPSRHFCDEWSTRPTLSPNSRSFYRQLVANHLDALGRIALIDVRPTDVREAVSALAAKPRTARDAYTTLAGIDYDVASERGGHAFVQTTYQHYREIAERRHREAAEQIDSFISSRRRALSDAVGGRVGG
jgi:integrase